MKYTILVIASHGNAITSITFKLDTNKRVDQIRDEIKNKRGLIPKTSVTVAEKRTGKSVTAIVKNQKLPKILPINFLGVRICRKVNAGIRADT